MLHKHPLATTLALYILFIVLTSLLPFGTDIQKLGSTVVLAVSMVCALGVTRAYRTDMISCVFFSHGKPMLFCETYGEACLKRGSPKSGKQARNDGGNAINDGSDDGNNSNDDSNAINNGSNDITTDNSVSFSWLGISTLIALALIFLVVTTVDLFLMDMFLFATPSEKNIPGYLTFCVLTGVAEEALLCGVLLPGIWLAYAKQNHDVAHDVIRAILISALLFGLAHMGYGIDPIGVLLKVVQAGAFAVSMQVLYMRFRRLWIPMAAHAVFDMVYFALTYVLPLSG